jgi:hypothetical protein
LLPILGERLQCCCDLVIEDVGVFRGGPQTGVIESPLDQFEVAQSF